MLPPRDGPGRRPPGADEARGTQRPWLATRHGGLLTGWLEW